MLYNIMCSEITCTVEINCLLRPIGSQVRGRALEVLDRDGAAERVTEQSVDDLKGPLNSRCGQGAMAAGDPERADVFEYESTFLEVAAGEGALDGGWSWVSQSSAA